MASNMSRTTDNITIVIRPEPDSPQLPYELSQHLSRETWDFRMRQIRALCLHYSKPMFERAWFIVSTIVTFVVPMVLYPVIFDAVTPKSVRDQFNQSFNNGFNPNGTRIDSQRIDDEISQYYFKARGITLAIFVGIVLLFWGPLIFWKRLGTFRANAMTRRWLTEDSSRGATFVPKWVVRTPGVFTITGRVMVTTPPGAQPSLFRQDAHLPPYLLQPAQNGAPPGGYFYPNGAPMYQAPQGPPPFDSRGAQPMLVDEKYPQDFHDVKV